MFAWCEHGDDRIVRDHSHTTKKVKQCDGKNKHIQCKCRIVLCIKVRDCEHWKQTSIAGDPGVRKGFNDAKTSAHKFS